MHVVTMQTSGWAYAIRVVHVSFLVTTSPDHMDEEPSDLCDQGLTSRTLRTRPPCVLQWCFAPAERQSLGQGVVLEQLSGFGA
jgi:hypothetical protein